MNLNDPMHLHCSDLVKQPSVEGSQLIVLTGRTEPSDIVPILATQTSTLNSALPLIEAMLITISPLATTTSSD